MAVKYPQMRTAAQDFATQTHVVTVEIMNPGPAKSNPT